ncbi:chorismate-binding protein [Psychroserpens sp. SPM9]|uniref:chorismate-binding protein n=1 Tax=Psychroserpens sp. SPM9 TaxID=2975598 RepID=UPI0021A701DA|nr:chorismate-binding protein [Psychroserpens sp. SPM9]MDG5491835.1 chorismate-binding protein [Psychroserpens sp. SPM9]
MLQQDFFSHITSHYQLQLPFVAYRHPNTSTLKGLLQTNLKVNYVDDFDDSGFVFSPFNSEDKTVIFSAEDCKSIQAEQEFSSDIFDSETPSVTSNITSDAHMQLVQKGIDAILEHQFEKVVLSRVEPIAISEAHPIHIFQSLLKKYSSAFIYIWYHPNIGLWLGATPETLLQVEGQRFKTMSLAGTQVYKNSLEVDWDSKNLEEQKVVTMFIKNQLTPFVDQLIVAPTTTVKAGQLLHLQSKISGRLKSGNLKEVIFALHPTPAVCGLPKNETKAFILEHENYQREFYTGFLGELNFKTAKTRNTNRRNVENNAYGIVQNQSRLYVNLRCMQIKDNKALIYVGGGITKDSNPQSEWKETQQKLHTMASVLS